MGVRTAVRLASAVLAAAVAALAPVAAATPAAADCQSPYLTYPAGEVDRGATITILGEAFGDACHDTGPPPAGEGVLGRPLRDVEIVIAQEGAEAVVATATANGRYELAVDVVVPAGLRPGEATVHARWPGGRSADLGADPLVVTDAPAPAPARGTAGGPADPPADDADGLPWPALGAAALAALAAATLAATARRRRRSTTPPPP